MKTDNSKYYNRKYSSESYKSYDSIKKQNMS